MGEGNEVTPRSQTKAALETLLAATDPKLALSHAVIGFVQGNADGTEGAKCVLEITKTGAVKNEFAGGYFVTLTRGQAVSRTHEIATLPEVIEAVFGGAHPLWPEKKGAV